MVSQSKLNQIPLELKRHGIEPTQQHIDAVASILESDGRTSVGSAVRRYTQSQSQQQPTEQPANSATAESKPQNDLQNLSVNLGDRIAEGVISQAVDHAMKRILSGDWTLNSQAKQSLENAKETLDVEFSTISENFLSLPSNGLSNGKFLANSEQIFDAQVLPQSSLEVTS